MKVRMKMRTRRKIAGDSRPFFPFVRSLAVTCCCIVCIVWASIAAYAGKKPKPVESYALIAGTVFQESGLSLRGAEIEVAPNPETKPARKLKTIKSVSDGRGEFAIRVPAEPMRYTVRVSAPGFRAGEKSVTISGDEHTNTFFRLSPEKKP